MDPNVIKKDSDTRLEISRVPSKCPEENDELGLKKTIENQKQEEPGSLKNRSEKDRSQGNETMGIP